MIVCLEGPSAVGKTTLSRLLEKAKGAAVVPEVNALFERPADASEVWYLEKQIERWKLAHAALASHPLVVLDGDPFQPLWYNWSFGFQSLQSLDILQAFYRPHLEAGDLGFPDCYVHLVSGEDALRKRKEADQNRSRRNFDRHLCLIKTQRRYFELLNALSPGRVQTVEAVSPQNVLSQVDTLLRLPLVPPIDLVAVFDQLITWLRANTAA